MALHVGTVTLTIVVALVPGCSSKVGFPKDQKMDVLFPPYIVPAGHGIPDGHLRPLGEFLMPAEISAIGGHVLIFRVKRARQTLKSKCCLFRILMLFVYHQLSPFCRMAEKVQRQDQGDTGNAQCACPVREVYQEQQACANTRRPSRCPGHGGLGEWRLSQAAVSQTVRHLTGSGWGWMAALYARQIISRHKEMQS